MNVNIKLVTASFVLLGLLRPLAAQEQSPPAPEQAPAAPAQAPAAPTQAPAAPAQTPAAPEQQPAAPEQQPAAPAQQPAAPAQAPAAAFSPDRLEKMAAPIALYPDALIAQILMASTYPLEIVEASRWVDKNPALKGAALEEALKQNEWDPSVKALCGVPTVLKLMNDNLDWTKDLGDAFLAQKTELMDTIQRMRRKAFEAGSLKTTEQQRVSQDGETIVIEPANPEVIYVPSYSPAVVYGPSWYYPDAYYPGWYSGWPWAFVSFGLGFWWGSGCCWSSCDWHNHCCNVNCNQLNTFNTHTSSHPMPSNGTPGGTATWRHDPAHRTGVKYRSPEVARSVGAAPGSARTAGAKTGGVTPTSPSSGTRSAPPMNRSGTPPTASRSGTGPGSGRVSGAPIRSAPLGTPPAAPGAGSRYPSAPSYRGSARSYSGTPSPSRGTRSAGGAATGYRGPGPSRS
jgi:hypothetical protein